MSDSRVSKTSSIAFRPIKFLRGALALGLALSGCSSAGSPIPMSPFESTKSRAAAGGNAAHGTSNKVSKEAAATAAPRASVFQVKWSIPSTALNIQHFKIEYGVDQKNLENSIKLNREELEAEHSSDNSTIVFKYPLSLAGDVAAISVRIIATTQTGEQSESAIFTSPRIGDSATAAPHH